MRELSRGATVFFLVMSFIFGALKADGAVSIVATDNGWDSQKFHNAIAELIVEHAYDGYRFDVSTASSTMNWQSIIAGDVDIDIESWTDNIASYPDDIANGDVVNIGVLVPDSLQGVYVPRYVIEGDPARSIEPMAPELKTVRDIKKYSAVFPDDENPKKGRLYGSIPGWMVDEILYKKFEYYGLSETFNYVRLGSEASLFASLVSAYNLGEPWVGYCYEPTWIAGRLDIVKLEDDPYDPELYQDGKCDFPSQELRIVSGRGFAKKAPDLVEFFKRYRTGSSRLSLALSYMEETKSSHERAAVWFLKNNDYLLDEWLPAENAQKMREYLSTR
ncbi:MAG: ABC transporter substrate-binding protein [Synergistaceae bacterium]|jgi:glycine betaine/proline transport system permease protein/glycine betaine/proline transport system substrate-binding protein|nr:ABC transporter substrate-binding protein [Synergistaceae bacterium]